MRFQGFAFWGPNCISDAAPLLMGSFAAKFNRRAITNALIEVGSVPGSRLLITNLP